MMIYPKNLQGLYMITAIEDITRNGDAYVHEDELFTQCRCRVKGLTLEVFQADKVFLVREHYLIQEEWRVYLKKTWKYEAILAELIPRILRNNVIRKAITPDMTTTGEFVLDEGQKEAICMALNHRLSLILGGAGTGKTTMVSMLLGEMLDDTFQNVLLCAPTGKAACNLRDRIAWPVRTVHCVLGKGPDSNFLEPVNWNHVDLVVVDEASMLTLELLTGILLVAPSNCRVVLMGDPNQLLSVGSGNVLPDLLDLGTPFTTLDVCHRQQGMESALRANVCGFQHCTSVDDLKFDDTFQLIPVYYEREIHRYVCRAGAERYLADENIQVLSPYNANNILSVAALNQTLRQQINPPRKEQPYISSKTHRFYDGDRVMVTENDWIRGVCNGHIGTFHLQSAEETSIGYTVSRSSKPAKWSNKSGLEMLIHAYAITVHKSQGSEYDTVIIPVHRCLSRMLYRNLLYTAISRAKKRVILVGSPDALTQALNTQAPKRKSGLVERARRSGERCQRVG